MKFKALLLLVVLGLATTIQAQDDNEFQRIAKRIMNAYDVGDEAAYAPDSSNWYGGAYLGASSKGQAMPSAYVTYMVKDKYLITANVSIDMGEKNTSRDIDKQSADGSYLNTGTNFLTNTEHTDMSIRLDSRVGRGGIFSFGLLETIVKEKVTENSIKSGADAQGNHVESVYQEQVRDAKDMKLGSLIQYIQKWSRAGQLTTRLNLKYNTLPTTIGDNIWSASLAKASNNQKQELKNFDPYAMIDFQSVKLGGFKYGLTQKVVLNDMSISVDDTKAGGNTEFDYDSYSSLTTLKLAYQHGWLGLSSNTTYENFHHRIADHQNADIKHTEHDWMGDVNLSAKLSDHHSLSLKYDRSIKRPTYTQLYPFVHIGSGIGAQVKGNTQLKPSSTQQYKLSHTLSSKHLSLTTALTYKHTDDDITPISTFDDAQQITVKSWTNDATYDIVQLSTEGRLKFSIWDITMGLRGQYLEYSGDNVSGDKKWSYSYKIRPQVTLPRNWTLATSCVFTGREVHSTYYNRSNLYLSARAVKQIDQWALYAFVQDILQEDRIQVSQDAQNRILTSNDLNGRCLIVGCSYTF